MSRVEIWFDQDMNQPVIMRHLNGSTFMSDATGTRVGIRCFRNGAAENVTGSVKGYFLLPDGSEKSVTGSKSGNEASITIPASALTIPGKLSFFIKTTEGTRAATIGAFTANVTPQVGLTA